MKCYKKEFKEWTMKAKIPILDSLEGVDFKIGDIVTYTNQYQVKFEGLEVLAFCEPPFKEKEILTPVVTKEDYILYNVRHEELEERQEPFSSRCVYLNCSSYWMPCKPSEINL